MVTSLIRPSFKQGFAKGTFSRRPNLWNGLVGAWKPSLGVTGMQLRDISGKGNHGTMNGSMTLDDWIISGNFKDPGYALDFDGTDDYIGVNPLALLDGLKKLSFLVWIFPRAWDSGDFVIEKGNTFLMGRHSAITGANGGVGFFSSGSWKAADFISSPPLNEWSLIAGVANGVNLISYLNGVQNIGDAHSDVVPFNADDVNFGGRSTTFPFNGLIGEIRIYTRDLLSAEILDSYVNPKAMFEFADRFIGRAPVVGGLSMPVAMHHYTKNIN